MLFDLSERPLVTVENYQQFLRWCVSLGQKHTERDVVINSYSYCLHRTPAVLEDFEVLIVFGRSKVRLLPPHYG